VEIESLTAIFSSFFFFAKAQGAQRTMALPKIYTFDLTPPSSLFSFFPTVAVP